MSAQKDNSENKTTNTNKEKDKSENKKYLETKIKTKNISSKSDTEITK